MNDFTPAFTTENDSEYYSMTPADVVKAIFDKADEKGVVYIPDFPRDCVDSEEDLFLECRLKCASDEVKDLCVELIEDLLKSFKELSALYEKLIGGADPDEIGEDEVSDKTLSVWRTYVRGFSSKKASEMKKEAAERLDGRSIAAYETVFRAQRLCKLLYLNAPPIITDNEAKHFAQALVLNLVAESVTRVKNKEKDTALSDKTRYFK